MYIYSINDRQGLRLRIEDEAVQVAVIELMMTSELDCLYIVSGADRDTISGVIGNGSMSNGSFRESIAFVFEESFCQK